jgi:hypothetical protein
MQTLLDAVWRAAVRPQFRDLPRRDSLPDQDLSHSRSRSQIVEVERLWDLGCYAIE